MKPKLGIRYRLFLAILLAAGLAVISMVLITQWSLTRGFIRYVNATEKTSVSRLADQLETLFSKESSWEFLRRDPEKWRQLVLASLPEEGCPTPGMVQPEQPGHFKGGHRSGRRMPPHLARQLVHRLFLLDAGKKMVVGNDIIPPESEVTELIVGGRVVGYVGILPCKHLSDERHLRFLKEQKSALAMVAVVIVLVAGALSFLLAKRLVRPIRGLAAATDRLAAGEFSTRVPVVSSDELGHLARDFNMLAMTLEKNEQARRTWVADISHELRTPLAVLRGEVEALQDGIRLATPATIGSLHAEVMHLTRLVDDLYQLAVSDVGALSYRKEHLDLSGVVAGAVDSFRRDFGVKNVAVTCDAPPLLLPILADRERLTQLFDNLLSNALAYTDPGGELRVTLERADDRAIVNFQDTPPGVSEEDMERLFDRLYRVESSRSRATGGAGLGLAICRNIVEGHGGSITAHPSPLGGVWIRVELPLAERLV